MHCYYKITCSAYKEYLKQSLNSKCCIPQLRTICSLQCTIMLVSQVSALLNFTTIINHKIFIFDHTVHIINTHPFCFVLQLCRSNWTPNDCHPSPRPLWRSVDALLGRGRVPPSDAIDVAEFRQYFDEKVAGVRTARLDLRCAFAKSADVHICSTWSGSGHWPPTMLSLPFER